MADVELLWTGGWDSTFRLVELSRKSVTIQPVYIYGDDRKSEPNEISAMADIREALLNRPSTAAQILEVKLVDKKEIPENVEIESAWTRIHKKTKLGTQYEWIARYALNNPGLEIGVEYGDPDVSYANCALRRYGELEPTESISRFKVDIGRSDPDVTIVLGNLTFPIIDKSELEMKELIREWGYEDIMSMIWFCHNPIHRKPCGLCRPCYEKIDSHMEELLPRQALKRNAIDRKWGVCVV